MWENRDGERVQTKSPLERALFGWLGAGRSSHHRHTGLWRPTTTEQESAVSGGSERGRSEASTYLHFEIWVSNKFSLRVGICQPAMPQGNNKPLFIGEWNVYVPNVVIFQRQFCLELLVSDVFSKRYLKVFSPLSIGTDRFLQFVGAWVQTIVFHDEIWWWHLHCWCF